MTGDGGAATVAARLSDIVVSYGGRLRRRVLALRGVSLELRAGVVTGLVGPNGAGKTTLLEVLVGALPPSSGRVAWFGDEGWNRRARSRIGFCPDVPALPGALTLQQALHFFLSLRGLDAAALRPRLDALTARLGLDAVGDQRVSQLSRGTLVRLGIAQALAPEPPLIVLDESFGALDPLVQVELRELIREHAGRGAAVLVSSHQLDQVGRTADEILLLHRGELAGRLAGGTTSGTALEQALREAGRSELRPRSQH